MTAAEMFCERVLDGITNWDKPNDRQGEENVAKSKGAGKKSKVEKLENGGNVFAKDWALKKPDGKGKTSKTAQDELVSALLGENYVEDADTLPQGETLEEHDRKKHKGHFDPSTQTCKFRDEMKKETETDRADEVSPESAPKADGGDRGEDRRENPKSEYNAVVRAFTNPDGTRKEGWMKAPNGKSTNLTERQWVQVRTPSFKKWFGDWENTPEEASKVVDENGEPRVVWHGSDWDILSEEPGKAFFDKSRVGQTFDDVDIDYNFFFTASEKSAYGYGEITSFFLNIRNPEIRGVRVGADMTNERELHEAIINGHDLGTNVDEYGGAEISDADGLIMSINRIDAEKAKRVKEEFSERIKQLVDKRHQLIERRLSKASSQEYINSSGEDRERLNTLLRNYLKEESRIEEELKEVRSERDKRMPTVKVHDVDMFGVDEPNQIKSATDNNGAFSTQNPDVRDSSANDEVDNAKAGGGEDGGQKKQLVSPEEDKEYMEAVERGDMETAAKMVREVAGRAFPNTKVVGRDGLPQIVFHGTEADFTEFDPSTISRESGNFGYFGKGFYFAGREDLGDYYAFIRQGKRMNEFVDIQNPFVYNDETISKIAKEIGLDNDLEKDWSLLEQPSHFSNQETVEKFTEAIKGLGYDGVLVYDRSGLGELVAFKPNQIKSADPVTYDDDGNIIPLSRRFDSGNDIRGDVSVGGDDKPSSVEKEESEDLESYDKNFTEGGEWKSPWNNSGPTFDTRKSVGVARNPWTKASRAEAEIAAQMLKRVLGGVTVGFSDKPYEGEGDTRKSIGGIYTGTSADYANESRQGGVGDGPSLMKIGSGEGSQVYGWGLYGSTVRGVAEGYARQGRNLNVAAGDAEYELDGKSLDRKNDVIDSALTYLASERMNTQKAIEEVNRAIDGFKRQLEDTNERLEWDKNNFRLQIDAESLPKRIRHLNEVKGFIERDGRKIRQVLPSENIYEQTFFTNREPGDESHLLNWYEPVRDEQVEWIQKKLKENYDFGITESGKLYSLYGATGADVYNRVKELLEEKGGIHNSPEATSRFLAEAGIDGVKYPVDSYGGKSIKNGNEAGWNYVSFRDDNIKVDHKWVDGEQRYFRNQSGKVVGEYDRNTNKITLYPGATVRDVVHEYSHGLWQFAEQEAEAGRGELLDKMKSIADTAPEEVKSAVAANYDEVTPDVYLEECFTHEMARRSDTAFAKAIGSKDGKPWYKRAWGAIKDAWKGLATKMGMNKADMSGIGKMSDGEAAEHILSQMMEGKRFGEVKGKGADESRKAIENDAEEKDKSVPENLKFIESIELPKDDDLIAFSEHTKKIRERMRKNQIELNNSERINNEAGYCLLADKVCEDGIILAQEALSLLGFDDNEINSKSSKGSVSVTHGIPGMLSDETLDGLSSVLSRFPILKGGCDFYAWETTSKRSYWDPLGINVNRGSAFRTYLHESGHWIEENDEDVHDLCVDFLKYRTDGEPFVHLGSDFVEIVKSGDLRGHFKSEVPITHNMLTDPEYEIGKKDRFRNSYAGKFYCQENNESDNHYKLDATEILSMGIQDLLQNTVSFIKNDSQYAQFVLGVLRRQNPLKQKRYNFA